MKPVTNFVANDVVIAYKSILVFQAETPARDSVFDRNDDHSSVEGSLELENGVQVCHKHTFCEVVSWEKGISKGIRQCIILELLELEHLSLHTKGF